MLKRSTPGFTVDSLVNRIRAGARRKIAGVHLSGDYSEQAEKPLPSENAFESISVAGIELQPVFRPHADDHYEVGDLLQYHDRAFVQNAYRAILKRGPDATGFTGFIEALRSGRLNKVDVLARLRYSSEGRAKSVKIDGLFFPASIRLLYGIPLLGYLLNLIIAIARLPRSIRSEQQFQSHTLAQQQMLADHANYVAQTVTTLSRELRTSLHAILQAHREQAETLINEREDVKTEVFDLIAEARKQFEQLIHERESEIDSRLAELNVSFGDSLGRERAARENAVEKLAGIWQHEQAALETAFATFDRTLANERAEREKLADVLQVLAQTLQQEQHARASGFEGFAQALQSEQDSRARVQNQTELVARNLQTEMRKIFQKQQEVRTELVLQGERVARMLDEAGSGHHAVQTLMEEADHALDAFYLSLETQFRGEPEEITERLRVYLPIIQRAGVGQNEAPILDVGCGRGEWLGLLKTEGYRAAGIDSNRLMVEECRERDLEVAQADLMDYLRNLPDASMGAITGFHIVEHLPFKTLVAFLDEAVRVLQPGGLAIFETPNPRNVLVGTCNFYFDPTHRNPLPSPVMKFLLESRGFIDVETLDLNPSDEVPVAGDSDLAHRFNQYFYGPMDYAVIGRRV